MNIVEFPPVMFEAATHEVSGSGGNAAADLMVAGLRRTSAMSSRRGRVLQLRELKADLRDVALVLDRVTTDTGAGNNLDEVISAFGFARSALETEPGSELAVR
jgi:hypothetical protein